ncbi:hypothetical protein BpHYR1_012875 [Brachionus plicatilis]|uniref:Uncharacterized protein n=1 Tax=Brachionus plicatilis TaxID=10195 RepID=A0A3M7QGY8_BRAPC|nr:hypothetical protein BpHYR1_012875 [Brachionus plicatilis]
MENLNLENQNRQELLNGFTFTKNQLILISKDKLFELIINFKMPSISRFFIYRLKFFNFNSDKRVGGGIVSIIFKSQFLYSLSMITISFIIYGLVTSFKIESLNVVPQCFITFLCWSFTDDNNKLVNSNE